MKNAKNVNFIQNNNQTPQYAEINGAVILPSPIAFEKFKWTQKYFKQKPKQGYFIWAKEKINKPLFSCFNICLPKITQNPLNLIFVDEKAKIEINSICRAEKNNLNAIHKGCSKIILKQGSELKIKHFHNWGKKDQVSSNLEFLLENKSKLFYSCKCLKSPKSLKLKNSVYLKEKASANLSIAILAKKSEVKINENIFLNGKKSRTVSRIKLAANIKSKIKSKSRITAGADSIGHIDCMGILLSNDSIISVSPELVNKNKSASLTHEASVGRISEENLNYLRSRGLTENEAIDLIVSGFLGDDIMGLDKKNKSNIK